MSEQPEPGQRLDTLLRTCIQCGLCLPHCATYLATGNEAQSPRGRLLLLGEIIHGGMSADNADTLDTFSTCLGCHACDAACPGGISTELLAYARELAADRLAIADPLPMAALESRSRLRLVRRLASGVRSVLRFLTGPGWRRRLETCAGPVRRLGRLLGSMPVAAQQNNELVDLLDGLCGRHPLSAPPGETTEENRGRKRADQVAGGPSTGSTVAFFRGCANASLLPGTSHRLQELLIAAGCDVVIPAGQECCGAVAAHTNRPRRVRELQQLNVKAFSNAGSYDYLLAEAAGCGLELSAYPDHLAEKVRDAVVLLDDLDLPPFAELPLRVVIHDPCHAQHGQDIRLQPRRLLARIPGLTVLEALESTVCCGSGGVYALRHPDLSSAMGRRKANLLAATAPDLVVTSNPGCLGQIADGLSLECPGLPIIPLTDLLWYAWQRTQRI